MRDTTEHKSTLPDRAHPRMVGEAVQAGTCALRGTQRKSALLGAAVLSQVNPRMRVISDESFGPAFSILPYEDIEPLFTTISASAYGLQGGICTNGLQLALSAIRTGGVIVNGTSRWRYEQMPDGGVKDSGIGREGPGFSIRDMAQERLCVLN